MSEYLWAYTPILCDDEFCVGDCDNCDRANFDMPETEETEEA